MKNNLITAVLMTLVTTVLFGLLFPLLITGLAQILFPNRANGQLLTRNGVVVGSRLIGQSFSSRGYFHSRPSAAGTGYDAGNSSGQTLDRPIKPLLRGCGAMPIACRRRIQPPQSRWI